MNREPAEGDGHRRPRVAAVVVTHSRYATLAQTLRTVEAQSRQPDSVVIVDNASSDDTLSRLQVEWPLMTLLPMSENLGPGAGIAAGMRWALEHDADILWLVEDDTLYSADYLETGLDLLTTNPDVGMLGSMGFRLHHGLWREFSPEGPSLTTGYPWLDGALVRATVARTSGLPVENFFIMMQDIEYPIRLERNGVRVGISGALGVEPQKVGASAGRGADYRAYYQTRNHLVFVVQTRSMVFAYGFVRRTIAQLIHEARHAATRRRVRLRLRGIHHAIRGRMGRTIEPASVPA